MSDLEEFRTDLRRANNHIVTLIAQIEILTKALELCLEWLKHVNPDYSNGNVAEDGMTDEGTVRGWEYHTKLIAIVREALGKEAEEGWKL